MSTKPEQTKTHRLPGAVDVRGHGLDAGDAFRERAEQKLARKLGRFAAHLSRVSLKLEDENGPKGGLDKVVRIFVSLPRAPSIVVEGRAASVYDALDRALAAAEGAVRAAVRRRRDQRSRPLPALAPV